MSRTIQTSLPSAKTDTLVEQLQRTEGVVGISVQRGASLKPPGDIVQVHATNDGVTSVLEALKHLDGVESLTLQTSEPTSLTSSQQQRQINLETDESAFEEMNAHLRKDSNLTVNFLGLMALSGAVAAIGLWQDKVHLVIGAMVIAPGFEPLLRVPAGIVSGTASQARQALGPTLVGYGALALLAGLTFFLLNAIDPVTPEAAGARHLVQYWSSVTPAGVLLALVAGAAGAFALASRRKVVFPGVMIALALVPSMALVGIGLAQGNWRLAGQGLLHWGVDVAAVMLAGFVVLGLKRRLGHHPSLD